MLIEENTIQKGSTKNETEKCWEEGRNIYLLRIRNTVFLNTVFILMFCPLLLSTLVNERSNSLPIEYCVKEGASIALLVCKIAMDKSSNRKRERMERLQIFSSTFYSVPLFALPSYSILSLFWSLSRMTVSYNILDWITTI